VAATFFMTGNFARTYPEVAHQIAADRFRIGNHTMTQLLGARWRRVPLQAGAPIRAVAGKLAREPAPGKVRA
jgi:hypothetical protein